MVMAKSNTLMAHCRHSVLFPISLSLETLLSFAIELKCQANVRNFWDCSGKFIRTYISNLREKSWNHVFTFQGWFNLIIQQQTPLLAMFHTCSGWPDQIKGVLMISAHCHHIISIESLRDIAVNDYYATTGSIFFLPAMALVCHDTRLQISKILSLNMCKQLRYFNSTRGLHLRIWPTD